MSRVTHDSTNIGVEVTTSHGRLTSRQFERHQDCHEDERAQWDSARA